MTTHIDWWAQNTSTYAEIFPYTSHFTVKSYLRRSHIPSITFISKWISLIWNTYMDDASCFINRINIIRTCDFSILRSLSIFHLLLFFLKTMLLIFYTKPLDTYYLFIFCRELLIKVDGLVQRKWNIRHIRIRIASCYNVL